MSDSRDLHFTLMVICLMAILVSMRPVMPPAIRSFGPADGGAHAELRGVSSGEHEEIRKVNRRVISRMVILSQVVLAFCFFSSCGGDDADPGFKARREKYFAGISDKAGGCWGAVARLAAGKSADLGALEAELNSIKNVEDCSDFRICGLVRLSYLYGKDKRLSGDMKATVKRTLLNFKYWIDEPGNDSMCYWSENHQILFHSNEYLAGNLYPDEVFPNAKMTGKDHVKKGKRLVEQWLGWRERFGFSEWFSNCYYEEDLWPLLNLVDFAPDAEIRERAAMAVDQLALNMALNSYRGMFMCTHGRSYERHNKSARGDSLKKFSWLAWGVRELTDDMAGDSGSATCLATSKYALPPAIRLIGQDTEATLENYQWNGIKIEEAPELGLPYDDIENGMYFWGMETQTHPKVVKTTIKMFTAYNLWENKFFGGLGGATKALAESGMLEKILTSRTPASAGAYLDDARTYGYRTPDYFLSSVLDRRPGQIGAQHLYWTAVLGIDAIVFTQHPGSIGVGIEQTGHPSYWTGNGASPRTAQFKNVLVAIYNAPMKTTTGEGARYKFTHAWFPKDAFDEVAEKGNWVIGRKGKGYVALYSFQKPEFRKDGADAGKEIIAQGLQNCWLCEMGREETDGSFKQFVEKVSSSAVSFEKLNLTYQSPSAGEVKFGWKGPFTVAGKEVELNRPMRYDNPYCRAERFAKKIVVECKGKKLTLDWENGKRTVE